MTKVQAYVLASKEFPPFGFIFEIKDRSMEIYAAAFAEWTQEKGWASWLNWDNGGEVLWCCKRDKYKKHYPTAELITEFEKQ